MKSKIIILCIAIIILSSCANLYKEVKYNNSKYKKSKAIKDLLIEPTLPCDNPCFGNNIFDTNIPFYSADGHGFFDTFTVIVEATFFIPFKWTIFGILYVDGSFMKLYLYTLRNYPDPTRKNDIKWYDKIVINIVEYPSLFICYTIVIVEPIILYTYDLFFHDIFVLICKPFNILYHSVFDKNDKQKKKIPDVKENIE